MELLSEMTNLTPRVVKVAVMPKNEQDVLDLMNFTRGFKAFNPEQEFVTMSMGKLGRLSRLGETWWGHHGLLLVLTIPAHLVKLLLRTCVGLGRFWMRIDGHTRLAAVVASPIKHSISPFIHNLAFEKTHVNGVYVAGRFQSQTWLRQLKILDVTICSVSTCLCHIRKR